MNIDMKPHLLSATILSRRMNGNDMNIDMKPTAAQRRIIKAYADYWGIGYRITRRGEVHMYGKMPNSRSLGWWLFAKTVNDALRIIST